MDDKDLPWLIMLVILGTPMLIIILHWLLFPVRIMRRDVRHHQMVVQLRLDTGVVYSPYKLYQEYDGMDKRKSDDMIKVLNRINYNKLSKEDKELYDYANHYIIK